jgi:hypothetical protein
MKSRNHDPAVPDRFEDEVHAALAEGGYIPPTTIDQVRRVEEEQKGLPQDLPPSLQNAAAVLERSRRNLRAVAHHQARSSDNSEVEQNLARAAREGKELSPEVEERMRLDRENAERAFQSHAKSR